MLHNLRHLRLCTIILAITVLAFGFGGETTLCFMPDGDVHMEQGPLACDLGGGCGENEQAQGDQGQCLDVALGGAAADHHHRNIVTPPVPALAPLGPPILLAFTDQKLSCPTPTVIPPQLVALRSVILLI